MSEQTIIQVSVDSELKEQVAEIYDRIGIDIPTAVRMFFKATVREGDLPFSTKVKATEYTSAEQFMDYMKKIMLYEPPLASDENAIVVLPLENEHEISAAMRVQLVNVVPAGKITCWEDMKDFLIKLYGKNVIYQDRTLPPRDASGRSIPYWRIVSRQGVLCEECGFSRERQIDRLIWDGVPLVQNGKVEGSYKVKDYKKYMFNFDSLKIIDLSPKYKLIENSGAI